MPYKVLMFSKGSSVPLYIVLILLSYKESKFKFCKSLNVSLLMQDISFAFNSRSCNDVNPLKMLTGNSFILFPYKTLKHVI